MRMPGKRKRSFGVCLRGRSIPIQALAQPAFRSLSSSSDKRTFGHTPRVGDSFCGGGSIPFEAARLDRAFTVADLRAECPGVSVDLIRKLLGPLRGKQVECLGRGQSAQWRRLN